MGIAAMAGRLNAIQQHIAIVQHIQRDVFRFDFCNKHLAFYLYSTSAQGLTASEYRHSSNT